MAKAYGDKPLARIATGERHRLIYIAALSAGNSEGYTPFSGVGFPRDAVFQYDPALFESLQAAWEQGDVALLDRLWSKAEPVQLPLAA